MSKTYPVSEIFGPTIQGEGPRVGKRTNWFRLAGCNDDCWWCDTKYAVNPKYTGWQATPMTAKQIVEKLDELPVTTELTISGGNPALFVDYDLMEALGVRGHEVSMETQGNRNIPPMVLMHPMFKYLVISPKPPSSGMQDRMSKDVVSSMISYRNSRRLDTYLKYVVFTVQDLKWIEAFHKQVDPKPTESCLSIGTTIDATLTADELSLTLLKDTRMWVERLLGGEYEYFKSFRILPQLHTLIWGRKRGV